MFLTSLRKFSQTRRVKRISNQAENHFPARFFAPSRPAHKINSAGKKKGRTMNPLIQSKNKTILAVLITLTLACFALSPQARAVCQQGCDPANDNTFLGDNALINNTTGVFNTAIGFHALLSNMSGSGNTATGLDALQSNTAGNNNTATGNFALFSNTTGVENTATGWEALNSNRNGVFNTATGSGALFTNTTGRDNTANGAGALNNNTIGRGNTADGVNALFSNTVGFSNTANGLAALYSNTTGTQNTANGVSALRDNTTGFSNTANGTLALFSNTTGSSNIAIGVSAGVNLTTGSNNIEIGNGGVAGEAGTIRLGTQGTQTRTLIAGISGSPITGTSVVVNINGRLGTVASSQRFKDDIRPMDKASEAILALKPVTFYYKKELDPEGTRQFGLVAEDVEKVNPALVARDEQGKPYTVRYDAVNAMLLNEFLKEHKRVQELEASNVQLKHDFAEQQKQIEALTAGLQKVSAQLELSKPAPQTVQNNR
jgi:trimeric autotransporter adhesin